MRLQLHNELRTLECQVKALKFLAGKSPDTKNPLLEEGQKRELMGRVLARRTNILLTFANHDMMGLEGVHSEICDIMRPVESLFA